MAVLRHKRDVVPACLLLLLLACLLLNRVAHAETLSRVVKPRQGKPTSVIKPFTRTALGSRCHCCICHTSLATLVIVLSFRDDCPQKSPKNALKWPFFDH